MADAIQAIDEHHFAGHKVLFSDTEAALAKRNGVARELCDLYNETALWYDGELITEEELAEAAKVEAPKIDELLISLTRAQVDLRVGSGLNVKRWLSPILSLRSDSKPVRSSADNDRSRLTALLPFQVSSAYLGPKRRINQPVTNYT